LGGKATSKHETGRDQPEEADPPTDEVQQAVPTDRMGVSWRSGWKAVGRVGDEEASANQTQPVEVDEEWSPGPALTSMQDPPHPNGTCDSEQASQDEQTDVNPSQTAVAHQAQIVTGWVEARTGEHLDPAHEDVEGTSDHATEKEHPGQLRITGCIVL
jgi:hypothetical protein